MKKSKLSLILALVIVLALVAPFTTYATDTDAQELSTTSETPTAEENDAVTTNEEGSDAVTAVPEGDDALLTDENLEENPEDFEEGELAENTLEEVKGNYHEVNTDIVFNKAVDGNVFLAGTNVTIQGKVNGDLYVFATTVTLEKDAQVYGNFFVIADTFTHSGLVYNLYAATTNYICEYDGLAALDLKVFADNIKFSGYAERTAYFSANNIELADDAYIIGNFVYSSSNEPLIGEKATIYGEKIEMNMFSMFNKVANTNQIVDYIIAAVSLLGAVLLIMLVLNFFKPNALSTDLKFNLIKCLKALGIGVLSVIALVIVILLLLVSVVFTKFATILLAGFVLALKLSSIIVIILTAIMLYNILNEGKSKGIVFLHAIFVALVYYALTIIPVPFASDIISLIIGLTGFGFIVLWLFNIRKLNKQNKVSDEKSSEKKAIEAPKEEKKAKKEVKDKKDNKKESDK